METENRDLTAGNPPASPSIGAVLQRAGAFVAALAVLVAPAWWNGFPLLQYDTGGYIARWYEGTLVPSRSTVFGLFLKAGEPFDFWPVVVVQASLTIWVLVVTLRALGVGGRPWRNAAVIAALALGTALPWLASMLLTDIFAGLGVLALYLIVCRADALGRGEKAGLFVLVAFAAASHSATFAVLLALVAAGAAALAFGRVPVTPAGLWRGSAAIALGAVMLVAANFALAGRLAWTPGGYSIPFGRMLQDGIVTRYLRDHCPDTRLRLCPYRDKLPLNADEFLWGGGVFDQLGRFNGLRDEMRTIVLASLVDYPWLQIKTAVAATATQLAMNGTGEGTHNQLWHTYGIIEHYLPGRVAAMRAAHQQRGELSFEVINRLHVPVAALSLVVVFATAVRRLFRPDRLDELGMLAATAVLALLANAFACGVISGPHDRYGARLVWIATFTALAALARAWAPAGRSKQAADGLGVVTTGP